MDDSDILNFGHTGKISFKAALQSVRTSRQKFPSAIPLDSSSQSSDCSDSDSSGRLGRKRAHQVGGKSGSLASKLIHNQLEPLVISSSDDSDNSDVDTKTRKKKVKKKTPSPLSSESSRSPSPEPSPPIGQMTTPTDQASKQALYKANNAIQQLIFSSYNSSDYSFSSDQNDSLLGSATKENFTLRVRYRGKIYRYTVTKSDPLSFVCSLLASEVGSSDKNKFLLTHKTVTLSEDDSPLTLGLTTADIVDAVQMSEPMTRNGTSSRNTDAGANNIKIKVQSSSKAITYSLPKTDPLKKAMEAFASELNMPLSKLTFSFDGDRISPQQTAVDLDMEDGDCIDVM